MSINSDVVASEWSRYFIMKYRSLFSHKTAVVANYRGVAVVEVRLAASNCIKMTKYVVNAPTIYVTRFEMGEMIILWKM